MGIVSQAAELPRVRTRRPATAVYRSAAAAPAAADLGQPVSPLLRPDAGAEVVYVIRDFQLIDPESYQRRYRRRDAKALAKGYYIVSWTAGGPTGTYDEDTLFFGPFKRRSDAEGALQAARRPR